MAVVAALVWTLVDSRGHPAAWVALAVAGSGTAYFVVQLLAPALFTLHLDSDGLRGRVLVTRVDVDWGDVQLARVRTIVGDPVLELYGTHHGEVTRGFVRVLLPVGADIDALHGFLAHRLGRSGATRTGGAPAR